MRGVIVPVISTIIFAASCLAAEQFRIPDARAKALAGTWNVVIIGGGEKPRIAPAEMSMAFIFRADGTGVQRRGKRENPIVWGADNKGMFAAQWKQDDGNGDGMMGTWKASGGKIKLTVREYEDGKHPGEDLGDLILKRGKKQPAAGELPAKLEVIWKENSVFLEDCMKRINAGVADSKMLLIDPTTPANKKEAAVNMIEKVFFYYPDSSKELVPAMAKMLGDKEVSRKTKESIMRIFSRMGTKAGGATGDIVDYIKNNFPPDSEDRVFAILALGDVALGHEFYVQESIRLLNHEEFGLRGRIAMKLLHAGVKNEKVISILKQAVAARLEIPGMLAVARASGSLTEDEKRAFAATAGLHAGQSHKGNIANYCIHKLRGDTPKALEFYEKALDGKSPLAMVSWYEMPFLSDSEISQLAPMIIEKMKGDRISSKILSFSFLLSELVIRERAARKRAQTLLRFKSEVQQK